MEEGKKPTIYDVAREAGVSIATVSKVMSGSLKVLRENTIRVRAAAMKLGYQKSPTAMALANRGADQAMEALKAAVQLLKQEHGNSAGSAVAWRIYYMNAPEMKLIREALGPEVE